MNFLYYGIIPLAVIFLEILLCEIFGAHLRPAAPQEWMVKIDLKAWDRLEKRMLVVSTLIVGVTATAVLIFIPIRGIEVPLFAEILGKIVGGFGYLLTPIYFYRILTGRPLWDKT